MDPNSTFGELIEKGQNAAANTVQNTAKNTASDVVNTVKGQITGKNEGTAGKPQVQSQTQASPLPNVLPESGNASSENGEFAREMVSDFYSPSRQTSQAALEGREQQQTDEKLIKVRQELKNLHMETYYNPLFEYENKKPEERPAEKVERQKMEDLQDLQQKEEKKALPIALQHAQTAIETRVSAG
jgi:hypothetical protein